MLSFHLIFKNDFYIDVISSEIKQQIADQMKNDSNKIYWSEKEDAPVMFNPSKIKRTNLSISMKTPISDCVSSRRDCALLYGHP